jgi:hypothetical protein
MLGMFGRITAIKDAMLAGMAKPHLQEMLAPYGTLRALSLDSSQRRVVLVVHLNGDTEPTEISVENYRIQRENGHVWIETPTEAFTSSRAWVAAVLNRLVAGKRTEIPAAYAKYVQTLL